jgi:hypothetical protein
MRIFFKCGFFNSYIGIVLTSLGCIILFASMSNFKHNQPAVIINITRERISINEGWRFFKYDSISDILYFTGR